MKKKKFVVVSVLISVLVLIIIPIIINELYKKGGGYTTVWGGTDILSYLGSTICSLTAAIISFYTLKEMQVQREKAYEPNIIFANTRIIIETGIKKIGKHFVAKGGFVPAGENWDVNNNTMVETIDLSSKNEYYLSTYVYNTGVGVCKYFSCEFSHQSSITWVEAYEKLGLIKKEMLSHDENDIEYSPKSKIRNQYTYPFGLDDTDTIVSESFLLPNAEKPYKLKLPFEYLRFLMLAIDIDDFYKIESIDLPPIDIIIQYSDVQGKSYNQTAQIKIAAFSTTVSNKGTLQYIYDISVEEIN